MLKIEITFDSSDTRRATLLKDTIMQLLGKCRFRKSKNDKVSIFWLTFRKTRDKLVLVRVPLEIPVSLKRRRENTIECVPCAAFCFFGRFDCGKRFCERILWE